MSHFIPDAQKTSLANRHPEQLLRRLVTHMAKVELIIRTDRDHSHSIP
jgi:hypothetical protein